MDILCRDQVIKTLRQYMPRDRSLTPQPLYLYGYTGTGKSLVLNSVLQDLDVPHVTVSCIECFTQRLLFTEILIGLREKVSNSDLGERKVKADNVNDFVVQLRELLQYEERTAYIVLDNAVRLRDLPYNVLPALLRVAELSHVAVSVILVSEVPWRNLADASGFTTGVAEPVCVHFPTYTKAETQQLMQLDRPAEYSATCYRQYCEMILSVFFCACNSLVELRHLARKYWPTYIQPAQQGECDMDNNIVLFQRAQKVLNAGLKSVYLREPVQQDTGCDTYNRIYMDLPFFSKFLLIASYLCSYNPVKSDRRFFVTGKAKVSKRSQLAAQKRSERTSAQLLGPKPYPMDRLLAVFYAIVTREDHHVSPSLDLFQQITTLCTLGLTSQVSSADCIDSPKYKCTVTLDVVKAVAKTVKFDLTCYLYDFVTK